jgi:hypothetical protein
MRLGSILGIGVTVLAAVTVSAQINAEYRVKAAFLYNVVKFVEWRSQPLCRRQIQASNDSENKRILTILAAADEQTLTIRSKTIRSKVLSLAEGHTEIA